MTVEQANESGHAGNMRQQAAGIMAEAFGAAETPATPAQEPEVQELETPEVEASGEEAGEGEAEQESQQQEAEEIRTLAQLADAVEVDPEFLYGLELPMGEGGGDPITIGEFKDKVQEIRQAQTQQAQLTQDREKLHQEQEAWTQQAQQAQQNMLQMPKDAMQAQAQMAALQEAWKHLEANKADYEAGDLALKMQEVQAAYGQAQQRHTAAMTQMQQQNQQYHQQAVQNEAVKLLEKVPEWHDQAKAQESRTKIGAMLSGYGFQPNMLDGIFDHRILLMLRDFADMQGKVATAQKVIAKGPRVPKVLRPGAAPTAGRVNKEKLKQKLAAARKTTNLRQKASAISDLLSGGN